MIKKVLIGFYFGKLPNYFELWLNCARLNPDYNFLLYIDDKSQYNFPKNVKVIYTTFKSVIDRAQNLYDFTICVPYPYKFCDFRPAFGEIFKDDIDPYEFWGTIDLDIIFGNFNTFITDDIFNSYDKILIRDHFTLYRNNKIVNQHYKGIQKIDKSEVAIYKTVFTDNRIYSFGEASLYGVYNIWKYNNWKVYEANIIADINRYHYYLKINNDFRKLQQNIFQYSNGHLYRLFVSKNKVVKDEYMYIHLQKRKMLNITKKDESEYFIVPNKLISPDNTKKIFRKYICIRFNIYNIFYKVFICLNSLKRKLLRL